jgi:hypothetical protein
MALYFCIIYIYIVWCTEVVIWIKIAHCLRFINCMHVLFQSTNITYLLKKSKQLI